MLRARSRRRRRQVGTVPARAALVLAVVAAFVLVLSALAGSRPAAGVAASRTPAVVTVTSAPSSGCPANLADELESTGPAVQLVTVNTAASSATYGLLTTWLRQGGCWRRLSGPWTARVGWNGVSTHKVEGDGTTPAGAYPIGPTMYGNSPNPGVHYAYHRLVCGDWWDEDPSSPYYNSFQHVPCGSHPSWAVGDSEALWLEKTAYQSFAWIEYNTDPVVAGRGSAIFLHDGVAEATAGCVSLAPSELDSVLDWLEPGDHPLVVIGTDAEIRGY